MFNHQRGKFINDIYIEELGKEENPTIIMLHGGFEDMEDLNSVAKYLMGDYHLIAVDSRGHGKSDMATNLSYNQLEKDLDEIIKSLNIKEFSMIGFSDGGMTAIRIANKYKNLVHKLILIGLAWSKEDYNLFKDELGSFNLEMAKEVFYENRLRYEKNNKNPDFDNLFNNIINMWTDETGYLNDSDIDVNADTLLIRGDDDFLSDLGSYIKLQNLINNCRIANIPFATHEVHKEQKQIVQSIIIEHLNSRNDDENE